MNNWTHEITDTSKAIHLGHSNMSACEIDSRRASEKMKIEVVYEPIVNHKAICDRNITLLLKKGHLLADIKNCIKPCIQFRGTLNIFYCLVKLKKFNQNCFQL